MDQSQQLTKLIEKALENGWNCPDLDLEERLRHSWSVDSSLRFRAYDFTIEPETLLFGNNLSFLKALFPSGKPFEVPHHFYFAEQLVIQDDAKRIPWLYSQVFGGRDD